MIFLIAAAFAATQPAAVPTAPAPALNAQMGKMGQAGPKKEECCCKDKMDKEHASPAMDRMPDHQDHAGR